MCLIGKKLEDFTVPAYFNKEITKVSLSDVLGHWSVFVFYPADFSFVCPTELEEMEDLYPKFKADGCQIYSVSEDTAYVHDAWAKSSEGIGKITYPMLADRAGTLARFFGVLCENAGNAYRGTFIIDPEGVIQAYTVNNMGIGRNGEEALRTLEAAQFVAEHGDQVCPAHWKKDEETIAPDENLIGKL